jgi:hypothetical protein
LIIAWLSGSTCCMVYGRTRISETRDGILSSTSVRRPRMKC